MKKVLMVFVLLMLSSPSLFADSETGVPMLWINGNDGGVFANNVYVGIKNADPNNTGRCWSDVFTGWMAFDSNSSVVQKQIFATLLAYSLADKELSVVYRYDPVNDSCILDTIFI